MPRLPKISCFKGNVIITYADLYQNKIYRKFFEKNIIFIVYFLILWYNDIVYYKTKGETPDEKTNYLYYTVSFDAVFSYRSPGR